MEVEFCNLNQTNSENLKEFVKQNLDLKKERDDLDLKNRNLKAIIKDTNQSLRTHKQNFKIFLEHLDCGKSQFSKHYLIQLKEKCGVEVDTITGSSSYILKE